MPTVELIRDSMPNILPMTGRSKGDHVSTLVHELCLRLGHYQEQEGQVNQARLELGNCWERALIQRLELDNPDECVLGQEIELDGIFGTPDLFMPNRRQDHEIKCTFMSTKHGPGSEKFWKYETQLKAYLHMLGWVTGVLHVCFVNGDYLFGRGGGGPIYRVWQYEFTKIELEMNWLMLLRQAVAGKNKRKVN